jgi:hypothetical protein
MAPSSRASPSVRVPEVSAPEDRAAGSPESPAAASSSEVSSDARSDTTRSFRYRLTKTETFARSTHGSNGLEM